MSDPLSVRFNLVDAQIQRGLQKNQLNINKTLERLSTGLRVNRSVDDPLGITVAKKLETRLLSQNQATDNLRAASLVTATASEGAQQILEGLKQIRSLTLSSLNDTQTFSDRQKFDEELKMLVEQIDRLARSTQFNDRNLLEGSSSAPVLFRPAESKILFNRTVTDSSAGTPVSVPFISKIVSTDASIMRDSVVEFRLFDSGVEFFAGLEIRSSALGLIAVTNNYLAFPNTYGVPTESLTGGPVVTVSLADLGFNQPQALSLNEYQNVSLQQLVDDRRIRPVSYGNLDLTLGGVTYNGVFNVQPNQTVEDVVAGLNGASVGSGSLSASYDMASSRVTLSYTNQRSLQASTATAYTPATPAASGGTGSDFTSIGLAPEGPAYRDPEPQPGLVFPSVPASLNTSLDFTGSNPDLLAALGINNVADSALVTGYEATYQGLTVATGNQSEYVNRTQVSIDAVSSSNSAEGLDTGLNAGDANTALAALTTAQVNVSAFGTGDFTVDFGVNGIYSFDDFDPATDTIQDILDGINDFSTSTGANVSASFDSVANQLTLRNESALNNQIILGGANGANIQAFFRLNDLPDTGTGLPQNSVSTGDISSQSVDASLDISGADVSGQTLEQLFTPRLTMGALSGALVINGQTALTVDSTTTLNAIVGAIDGLSGSDNRTYSASFDTAVTGGLQIQIQDREVLMAPAIPAGVDPGGATPQVTGNQITLDSATYISEQAPLSYQNGTPLGSGSGPAEQLTFQSTALSGQYGVNAPDPATENLSAIQFSGSNIGSVLHLQDTLTGTPSALGGSDLYRGTIVATGTNTYALTAEYQRDFVSTSSAISNRAIGFETPIGQGTEFGLVGELFIRANQPIVSQDRSLVIQSGADAGQTHALGINSLTAAALRLESLTLIGADDKQTRLLGLETLNVLDNAIDATLGTLAQLGASQRIFEQAISGAQQQREHLQQALSQTQDADIAAEVTNLTRAQINVQAAAFALSENRDIQQRTFDLLLNRLGEIRLRDF